MAVLGYLNPRDLAGWGPALMLSLIGLLILLVVSSFVDFEGLDLVWTALGLVLFSLYTAYDVNQLRHRARQAETNADLSLVAINASVDVYLDLANLVVEILRLRQA